MDGFDFEPDDVEKIDALQRQIRDLNEQLGAAEEILIRREIQLGDAEERGTQYAMRAQLVPDLLAACKAALKTWVQEDVFGYGTDEDYKVAEQLRAAIRKAEGEG